ncbi:MAG TPA: hypothetical protein VK662_03315, partial [Acidothermaceae bacterium]|nr:hypothetical protein [Acidothermaceae bacterium]
SPFTRADLNNPFVGWAQPTPESLAAALSRALDDHRTPGYAAEVARSVEAMSWEPARQLVVETIEKTVRAPAG